MSSRVKTTVYLDQDFLLFVQNQGLKYSELVNKLIEKYIEFECGDLANLERQLKHKKEELSRLNAELSILDKAIKDRKEREFQELVFQKQFQTEGGSL